MPDFFQTTSEEMFSGSFFQNSVPPPTGDPLNSNFMMGNDWDMSAALNDGTGIAPMSEGSWNQMLESINLGWDSLGPPHTGGPEADAELLRRLR